MDEGSEEPKGGVASTRVAPLRSSVSPRQLLHVRSPWLAGPGHVHKTSYEEKEC